jgi:hypothetical protein
MKKTFILLTIKTDFLIGTKKTAASVFTYYWDDLLIFLPHHALQKHRKNCIITMDIW